MDWGLGSTCSTRQLWHADLTRIKKKKWINKRRADAQGWVKKHDVPTVEIQPPRPQMSFSVKTHRGPVSFDRGAPVLPRRKEWRGGTSERDTMNHSPPPPGLFVHNHTNVANPRQLRLATSTRPTFFLRRPSLPGQRAASYSWLLAFPPLNDEQKQRAAIRFRRRIRKLNILWRNLFCACTKRWT